MVIDNPDFDNPTRADDVGLPDGTLGPTEATDSDDLRNKDGDEVVDPPDHWYGADKLAAMAPGEHESLDDKIAAEEPDPSAQTGLGRAATTQNAAAGAQDFAPPEVARNVRSYRGQVDGTPEDGESFFPVIEGPG
jgi:hypothetical protein